jgi:hypothetical protein
MIHIILSNCNARLHFARAMNNMKSFLAGPVDSIKRPSKYRLSLVVVQKNIVELVIQNHFNYRLLLIL